MNSFLLGLATLFLTACGGGDGASRATVADTLVVSADPALEAMASEMLPELAARSGFEIREPVHIERRSRAQLEGFLRAKLDQELPPERARNLAQAYHLLGMMPADLDLRQLLLSVYLEQVAGFYDPDSTALFVLDDQSAEVLRPIVLHELVHAVQDQSVHLDSLTSPALGNDRRTAAQSAIEGHATLVMLEYMSEQAGGPVDLAQIPGMAEQLGPLLEAARDQYPALAGAPEVIQQGLLLPYLAGATFVLRLWQSDARRPPPFGAELPTSTEQVLEPERFLGEPRDMPTEVDIAVSGDRILMDDVLGQAETDVMLRAAGGTDEPARGWDGDRWALLEPATGGDPHLVWASVWDSAADRDRVQALLESGSEGFPGGASVVATEWAGRPGLLLRVGGAAQVEVALEGGSP